MLINITMRDLHRRESQGRITFHEQRHFTGKRVELMMNARTTRRKVSSTLPFDRFYATEILRKPVLARMYTFKP